MNSDLVDRPPCPMHILELELEGTVEEGQCVHCADCGQPLPRNKVHQIYPPTTQTNILEIYVDLQLYAIVIR